MHLLRRSKAEEMFYTKSITGMWATDTMDGRVKYLDMNWYAQVFSNGAYFAEIYPMDKKSDAGQALKTFLTELGVPEELTVDGSKEQNSPGTEFMNRHFFLLYYFLNPYIFPIPSLLFSTGKKA